MNDIELTVAALEQCGYRTKIRERSGTQWVEAVKGLDVRYTHWHPLTNISQAMQLLIDAPVAFEVRSSIRGTYVVDAGQMSRLVKGNADARCAQDLINHACGAIVTAIAGLK